MTTLKAIIGANYGDEGKGRMTDYLIRQSTDKSLVVCTNGGAQRGHTVYDERGKYHIFHHFGSGTLAGADTYLPSSFIVNPMIFMQEYTELQPKTRIYISPDCLCSTPFDMMCNQIIEEARGKNKHSSCGVGIWETILRNEATLGEMIGMSEYNLRAYLHYVRDAYFINRLKSKGVEYIPKEWAQVYYSPHLIENYISDLKAMFNLIDFDSHTYLFNQYKQIVFENGQGLLIGQEYVKPSEEKYSTPSNTGSKEIEKIINDMHWRTEDYNLEVCYVTRSYLTRHGKGELLSNVGIDRFKADLIKGMCKNPLQTETNTWNKNQGDFRFGNLNMYILKMNILKDYSFWRDKKNITLSVAITHMDERSCDWEILTNTPEIDKIYLSNGVKKEDIIVLNKLKKCN